jgi:hypothetical protein
MSMTKTKPVCGIVWRNGTAVFLSRVVGWDNVVLQRADVDTVSYTVSLVSEDDPNASTPVEDHEDVALTPADVLYDSLVTNDDRWTVDEEGYNFLHLLDNTVNQAFTLAGRRYLVTFWVTPTGQPAIPVVFQVDVKLA